MNREPAAPASSPTLLRAGAHTVAASVVSLSAGFATTILVARALGPEGKGEYDLAMTTAMLGSMVLGLSLPVGITYAIARRLSVSGALLRRVAGFAVLQGAVMAGLLMVWFALPDAGATTRLDPVQAVAALATLVAVGSLGSYLRAALLGHQRFIETNRADALGRLAVPAFMLVALAGAAVLGQIAGPEAFLWAAVAAAVVTTSYYFALVSGQLAASREGPRGMRTVLGFSLTAHLGNVVQFLNYRLDVFVVTAFVGTAALGIYALAVSVAQLLWLVSSAAGAVLFPRVASAAEAVGDNAARTAQIARVVLALTVLGAIVLALAGALLIRTVYGDAFSGAVRPLLLLLPGIALFAVPNVLSSYIAGVGRPRLNVMVSVAGLIVTVALDFTLIPLLGIEGAAIATTASYATASLLTVAIFARMTGIPAHRILIPSREDIGLLKRVVAGVRRGLPGGAER